MYTEQIPVVPLDNFAPFPGCEMVFEADREYLDRVADHVQDEKQQVAIVAWDHERSDRPTTESMRRYGVIARFAVLPYDEQKVLVAVEGSQAIEILDLEQAADGVFLGRVRIIERRRSALRLAAGSQHNRAG